MKRIFALILALNASFALACSPQSSGQKSGKDKKIQKEEELFSPQIKKYQLRN